MEQIESGMLVWSETETETEFSSEAASEAYTEAAVKETQQQGSADGLPWIFGIVMIAAAAAAFFFGRAKKGNRAKPFMGNQEKPFDGGAQMTMEKQSALNFAERKREEEKKRERLLRQKEAVWEARQCEPYRKLFLDLIPTFQELIGMEAVETLLPRETVCRCVKKRILPMIAQRIESAGGIVRNRKVILPGTEEKFDREGMRRKLSSSSDEEVERLLRQYSAQLSGQQNELSDGSRKPFLLCAREIVQKTGMVTELLKEAVQGEETEWNTVKRAVQTLKNILEENGVFVMFAEDERLREYPSLRRSFTEAEAKDIPYPGFFVKREGKLEIFGAYLGSFIREEKRGAENGRKT